MVFGTQAFPGSFGASTHSVARPGRCQTRGMDDASPKVTITYCTQCNWLLRASWMAGELLQTFAAEVGEVALRPGTGGIFRIEASGPGVSAHADATKVHADATKAHAGATSGVPHDAKAPQLVWDRKEHGGFPDIVDLKRRVRDVIAPDLALGHADRAAAAQDS